MTVRPPAQPSRDTFSGEELDYHDRVIERERNRGTVGPDGLIGGPGGSYYAALLNSPEMAYHVASLGRLVRLAGDRGDSFSHADREWVDQVLCKDWGTNVVMGSHLPDALARGVRLEAVIALREGREHDLTDDERFLTDFIRRVTQGRMTDEVFQRMVDRLGQRGAIEYAIFVMFLTLTMRLIETTTGRTGPTDEEVMAELRAYRDGERELPSELLIGA